MEREAAGLAAVRVLLAVRPGLDAHAHLTWLKRLCCELSAGVLVPLRSTCLFIAQAHINTRMLGQLNKFCMLIIMRALDSCIPEEASLPHLPALV